MEEIRLKIREFLSSNFRGHTIRDNDDIFSLGFMNSLLAIQLVAFIENEFEITIKDADMNIDHFRSINAITNLIERRRLRIEP